MHIPDGYLSPGTCAVMYAAMVPVWVRATRRIKKVVKSRYVPLVAVASAFSFLIMMFNVPIPGGTTGHAVGAVAIAILLGPWAAVIAVSIALGVQALFFGDGGILSLGANCFNMAFVMPFVGYGLYRALSRGTVLTSARRVVAAGVGAYVGLAAAALCTSIEFGIQPTIAHTADGTPLYAPFHLSQAIPAMMIEHLLLVCFVEAAVTCGIIAYMQRANLPLLRPGDPSAPATEDEATRKTPLGWRWAFVILGVMVLLAPLGLLAPGGAFGEDAPGELDLGEWGLQAVPTGLERFAGFWSHTLLGDYGFASGEHPAPAYVLSALVGIAVIGAVMFGLIGAYRLMTRERRTASGDPAA